MMETIYNPVWTSIVRRSLRIVGAYDADGDPSAQQMTDATEALKSMLKAWQIEQFLWLKSFIKLSLEAGKNNYLLGPDGTATYGPDYTAVIDRPTKVWSLRRLTDSSQEVPLGFDGLPISRNEWEALPNKTTTGTVVQAYYDPQLVNGVLYVWPTPVDSTDSILMTGDRPILLPEDEDTLDLPQEWQNTVVFCLAEVLSWEYPGQGLDYQLLAARASSSKELLSSFDRETAPTQYYPDMRR